jgi:hypothetical protein
MDELENVGADSEAYLLDQLKRTVEERRAAMARIHDAYANDPRAKRPPLVAGMREFLNQPGFGGYGRSPSYGPIFKGADAQEKFLFENKVAPDLLALKEQEVDPFTKLFYRVKANQLRDKQDCKVINGSLVCYNAQTKAVDEVFKDVRNSPLYAKMLDMANTASLDKRREWDSEEQRTAWVVNEAERLTALATAKDRTRIGSPNPVGPESMTRPGAAGPQIITNGQVGTTPAQERPSQLTKEKDLRTAVGTDIESERVPQRSTSDFIAPTGENVFGQPAGTLKSERSGVQYDERSGKFVPLSQTEPRMLTGQDLATRDKLGTLHAEENAEDRKNLSELKKMNMSLQSMKGAMNEESTTFGPAHEILNKMGGYIAYIDPDAKLAQFAGNDAAYFANMMNLTRDKIQALGAGTAVSNLDLIVTQKSVGDLRNTREGNKKLFALMELHNAMLENGLKRKIEYFDKAKTYDKYKGQDGMTHIIRRTPSASGSSEYWIQSREDWIQEQVKAGRATAEQAAKDFDQQSYNSVSRLFKVK